MQVFKTFMKILKSNLPSASIYIIIFIVVGTLMAANSSKDNTFKETKVSISIIDQDNTQASKALTSYIGKSNKLVDIENDKDTILDALYYQNVSYVLTIKSGYEDKISKGETNDLFTNYKVPGNYTSQLVDSMINEYVSTISSFTTAGNTIEQATEKTIDAFDNKISVTKEDFSKSGDEYYAENVSSYFQFLPYIVISVIISAICPVLLVMTKKDMRNRVNCSCVSTTRQTGELILGVSVFVFAVWAILSAVMILLYKPAFTSSLIYGLLNSLVFVIISAGIALLAAQLITNEKAVSMIANVIGLGMSFLCGVFVPQDMLGSGVLTAAKFLPAYWYVRINNMLSGTGEIYDTTNFTKYLGIEILFAAALFALVILVTRLKRKNAS